MRFEEVHTYKARKYLYKDLIEEINTSEFIPSLITVELGNRGPYDPAGFNNQLMAHITQPKKGMDRHANKYHQECDH